MVRPVAGDVIDTTRDGFGGPAERRGAVIVDVQDLEQTRLGVGQRLVNAARRPKALRRLDTRLHLALGFITVLRLMPEATVTAVLPARPNICEIAPAITRRCTSLIFCGITSKNPAEPPAVTMILRAH
jgi:hypothetical protein